TPDEAQRRRDRGVEGFVALKRAFDDGDDVGRAALERCYALAEARTRTRRGAWRAMIERGPGAAVATTLAALNALEQGDTGYLADAEQALTRPGETALGFCGSLNRYFDP